MSSVEGWTRLHDDRDAGVRVFTTKLDTQEERGQELLADPLTAIRRTTGLRVGEGWTVQLQVVNAQVPSGPLPLPGDIEAPPAEFSWWPWVIRKIVIFLLIFDDLELVVVVVRRCETTREDALKTLEDSRSGRPGEP